MTVGFESIDNEELKRLNKKADIATNLKANQILKKFRIINMAHMLIKPQFTNNDFNSLNKFMFVNGITNPVFPIFTGLPGTILFNKETSPELYPYFDLAHPMEKTALPIKDFFRSFRELVYKNYSYLRWIKGNAKQLINRIFKFLGKKPLFNWYEIRIPNLLTIPYYRYFIGRNTSRKKLKTFYEDYQTYYEKPSLDN